MKTTALAGVAALLLACTTEAAESSGTPPLPTPDSVQAAIAEGKSLSSFRLRDEHVSQDGKTEEANALTLRSLLGWQTAPLHGFSVGAQIIGVSKLQDDYNDLARGINQPGRGNYPVVADPDYFGVNQLYVDWTGLQETRVRVGRQSVKLDNVRFVGNVEFRQVMQVFDGASVETRALLPDTTLFAAHFDHVTQVSTLRQSTDINLVNIRHALSSTENLIGYGYFIGWDAPALQADSSRTIGVRLDGARPLAPQMKLLYTAEYAKQDPYKDGASSIDSHYERLGAGVQHGPWFARVDREVLSGDGTRAFQTPLGTNHLFQGWVDKFLVTPKEGLRDTFLTAGTTLGKTTLLAEIHRFSSDVPFTSGTGQSTSLGREWDVSAAYPVTKQLTAKLEYGRFSEGSPHGTSRYRDTEKLWATLLFNF